MVDVSDLIGIPYKEHGRDKTGLDCYGLAIEVSKRFGNDLTDFDYKRHTDDFFNSTANNCIKTHAPKKIQHFIEGALVLFCNTRGEKNHIGVYIGDGYIIHCNSNGVHLSRTDEFSEKMEIYIWQN